MTAYIRKLLKNKTVDVKDDFKKYTKSIVDMLPILTIPNLENVGPVVIHCLIPTRYMLFKRTFKLLCCNSNEVALKNVC